MHVALIADESRLAQEPVMLDRVAVGLLGAGLSITRVHPPGPEDEARSDAGTARLTCSLLTTLRVLPMVRAEMTASLARRMTRETPDILYAHGDRGWRLALDLARRIDRPVALDVWSAPQIRQLPRGRRARCLSGVITPTETLAGVLGEHLEPDLVCTAPFGVAIPPHARSILEAPRRSISLAIIGGGRDVPAYRAMLEGLSRLIHEHPEIRAFIELQGPYEHEIWRHARRLDLLEHVSALADAGHHRTLLTCCDMLVVPERFGELRSLMLEAMAVGLPVVASADPYLEMLIADENAVLVDEPEPEAWARGLRRLVSEPELARTLGAAGRRCVANGYSTSTQVARIAEALRRIAAGGNYDFAAADEARK